ncbi:MAG: GNAT family N-acetyltransferase [Eubacteriales bacterium]
MDLMKIDIIKDSIRLRPIRMQDKDDIYAEFTDEVVEYMLPNTPKDIDETIEFIDVSIATMEAGYNIQLCIVDAETDEFFGCIGLHRIDKDIPEFGIWLKKSAHGKGIGKKSIKMLYDFACENLKHKYYKYPVDERNIPSSKIPEFLGGEIAEHETYDREGREPLRVVVYKIRANRRNPMITKAKEVYIKYRQFILFCVVGAMNTIITLAVLYVLNSIVGLNHILASDIGYLCGVVNGYIWSTFLVFKKKKTVNNAVKFIIVNLIVLSANTALMYLFVDIIGMENSLNLGKLPAQAITICFTMVMNFLLNKFWTFKEK